MSLRLSQKEFDFLTKGKFKKKTGKKLKLVNGETKHFRAKNVQLEKQLQKDIEGYILLQRGFDCVRHDSTGTYYKGVWLPSVTPRGYPDIELWFHGKVFFIEVKLRGEKQSPAQIEFEERCQRNNILYKICYDLNDAMIVIDNIRASFLASSYS